MKEHPDATLILHYPKEDVEFDIYLTNLKRNQNTIEKPRCGIFCEHPDPIDKPAEKIVISKWCEFSGVTSGPPKRRPR